jgi:hypothetical protein
MVHWWVQVHFGRILPHTSFSVFFFHFLDLKFWQKFIKNFKILAKIALGKKKSSKLPNFFLKKWQNFAEKII